MSDQSHNTPGNAAPHTDAPFAYEGLERVIHEKARLGILASLVSHGEGLAFSDLKQLCALTDGNLNRHLQVLQDAGLVVVQKLIANKRPQTLCSLTAEGRRRFVEYLGVLEQIVDTALHARVRDIVPGSLGQGFSPA
jgi:DNA-binding MarR family transcriptional regulator